MTEPLHRRHFLGAATMTGIAAATSTLRAEPVSKDPLIVGIMGTGGRGTYLSKVFAQQAGVKVGYVCDVDPKRMSAAAGEVTKITTEAPKQVGDFRKILEDKTVDILVVATCNHWHAPATILGCAHGKHVYVEKPCSHNPREGELLVEAAKKHSRMVQMGNHRRSWEKVAEAMKRLSEGVIGRPYLAQSWYTHNRPTIGVGKAEGMPEGLDYELWQGPAPRRPFRSNILHYNWHWFWNWGNGELGNNGIHYLDLCRWGLGVEFPVRVTSSGGRYRFEDDQETPDTHFVSFEFEGRKSITWEGLSCNQLPGAAPADVVFHGEKGSLVLRGGSYTIHDVKGKEIEKVAGTGSDTMHVANFLAAIRGKAKLTSEMPDAHRSTLLCHLGNIAHRTGRSLKCDPKNGQILNDPQAMTFWSREYAKGFEPVV